MAGDDLTVTSSQPLPDLTVKSSVPLPSEKKYAPGRQFGMDVARGMGLNADAIAAAEDMGGQPAALKELGSQVLEGFKGFLKDPLSPISGSASNFEDAVKSGSPGKIVGALSTILGGSEAAEKGPGLTSDLAANALRDETGNLRPAVKVGARGVGALAGHATGIPGAEIAGMFSGPSLADALIPNREPTIGKAVPIRNSPNFNAAAYNAGRATSGLPQGNPTPFQAPPAANPVPLSDLVKPSVEKVTEGRPATWTNEVVRERAAWGDPDAIAQAQARGFGRIPLKYSTTETAPKSVTRFDAQGNAIKEGPEYAYRVRDVGEQGVPANKSHAHASTTLDEAESYAPGRESVQGKPQEIVKYDLSKLKEGVDYERVNRPGQPDWIRMLRPLKEADVQVVGQQ